MYVMRLWNAPCACQVNAHREAVINKIEQSASELRRQGACAAWFKGADAVVHAAAHDVNGPLMELLAKSIKCVFLACAFCLYLHVSFPVMQLP